MEVENSGFDTADVVVCAELYDADSTLVASNEGAVFVTGNCAHILSLSMTVKDPHRWSVDDPACYQAVFLLKRDGEVLDSEETLIGFRTAEATGDRRFLLNGKPLQIRGICCHQDHAGVGVAVPDALVDYRISPLKEAGFNAYRCAHNPPSRALLDACDRYGMMMMDENRCYE